MSKDNAQNRLLGKFPSMQEGIWEVRGEDPNCDLGGPHHQPLLGYYKGRYGDIVDYALELNGFFQWGYGGDIKEVKILEIDASKKKQLQEAKAELRDLEKRKKDLEAKITWLTVGGA